MQKFFKSELGRSMVEMLGVLALVGVLSIAAVAGYSYAITKWKANETISDLHIRALEYTRQMAFAKKFAPDFAFNNFDLGDENALGNPVAGFPLFDDPDFFEIEVLGVSTEVCRQIIRDVDLPILNVAVNDGAYGAKENQCGADTPGNLVTMTFLFSNSLEDIGKPHNPPAEVTQPRPDDCPETRWANIAGVCCGEDEIGTGGYCCSKSSTGWGKNVGRCCAASEVYSQGHCCPMGQTWDKKNKHCVGGDDQCATNEDCHENEYCNYLNSRACWDDPTTGVCKPAIISESKKVNGFTYKRSKDIMNFWSAENFCARLGGSLVSISDFKCGYDFVTNKKWAYCNTDSNITKEGERSATMKEFMSFKDGSVWTVDEYGSGSCSASYLMYLVGGEVKIPNVHWADGYSALCRLP